MVWTGFLTVAVGAVLAFSIREIITRLRRTPPKPPQPVTRYTKKHN